MDGLLTLLENTFNDTSAPGGQYYHFYIKREEVLTLKKKKTNCIPGLAQTRPPPQAVMGSYAQSLPSQSCILNSAPSRRPLGKHHLTLIPSLSFFSGLGLRLNTLGILD